VLLCRLIQLLDNAVPWNDGPRWDLEAGEEPLYIPRDFRLTPLVAHLSATQKQWLSSQPFMATADTWVDDPTGEWAGRMTQVCVCGSTGQQAVWHLILDQPTHMLYPVREEPGEARRVALACTAELQG
jgi:hypothetical protein